MSDHPTPLGGRCNARFEPMRELFAAKLDSGEDLGASLAVNIDGEMVVDLWGGWADEGRTRPWLRDTITCVFSTTKTMGALAALVLVERGELDLDAPVTRYWPEFGAAGKSGVLVRHILSHTSGLSGWVQPVTLEDLYDWDRCTALLAAQEPWWMLGTASGYHAYTMGFLVGEVVRRISVRKFGRFFAEEIAEPLGADFHIGLARSEFGRVAKVVPCPPMDSAPMDPDSVAFKTMANGTLKEIRDTWSDAWPTSPLPMATAMPTPWRASSRRSPVAAKSMAYGCSRRRRSTGSSQCKAIRSTWCWAYGLR